MMATTEKTLIEALVAAQAEMPNPPLDGFNPHFKSKFSTLLAVRDTVIPILNKHGIAVTQSFGFDAGSGPVLTTTLLHSSGKLESHAPIPAVPDVQKWAAAVTYIRRISLLAIAGVVGDPDADAEDVVRAPEPKRDFSPLPDTSAVPVEFTAKYVAALRDAMAKRNDAKVLACHEDLNGEGQEAYAAVWKVLGSGERSAIKEAITRAREVKGKF